MPHCKSGMRRSPQKKEGKSWHAKEILTLTSHIQIFHSGKKSRLILNPLFGELSPAEVGSHPVFTCPPIVCMKCSFSVVGALDPPPPLHDFPLPSSSDCLNDLAGVVNWFYGSTPLPPLRMAMVLAGGDPIPKLQSRKMHAPNARLW